MEEESESTRTPDDREYRLPGRYHRLLARWLARRRIKFPGALQGLAIPATRLVDRRLVSRLFLQSMRHLLQPGEAAVPTRFRKQAAAPRSTVGHV